MELQGLKHAVETQGLNCGELAKAVGVSKTHMSRLMTMSSGASIETAVKLAQELNVSVADLLEAPKLVGLIKQLLEEVSAYNQFAKKAYEESGVLFPDITR